VIEYRVKPSLDNEAVNALYAVAWPAHGGFDFRPVFERALTYVHAYDGERLIGSVYVAWDGAQHAFLLEPTVHPDYRRRGIGRELVRLATEESRRAGCEWIHVDYGPELAPFYAACGFRPTEAGLIRLDGRQQK
jgi:predicted N-acetyltransferase YhbS